MDYLASAYIDDELDLDEKIRFVDKLYAEGPFYEDTRALLVQEKHLRKPPDTSALPDYPPRVAGIPRWLRSLIIPMGYAAAGFAAAGLLVFNLVTTPAPMRCFNRFVIYEPAAHQVELAGSFTQWQRMPMKPVGTSGYWQLHLHVPAGEHRFTYILDGARRVADPTLPVREMDDFGGSNSILTVENQI